MKSLLLRNNMNKLLIYPTIVLFCMLTSLKNVEAQSEITFELSFSEPQAHYVDVKMDISGINKGFIDIKMPVWAPGSYLIREFSKNVEQVQVKDADNNPIVYTKLTKNTWRIPVKNKSRISVYYKVYAFEISVRTSFVDDSHAFISPTGVFMYVDDLIKTPSTVKVIPYKTWSKVSTGLEAVKGKAHTFYAPDFDVLFDSPLEIGNQDTFEFKAAGITHEVAMYGGGNYDKVKLSADMKKIIEAETAIFKDMPNKRYVFIVHNFNSGGGGLEHLNSTVLGASRNNYADPEGYKSFLGLVAHEYFHLWNVKRLRPEALGPFDYSNENYTTDLWISEGFTAYYDNLMLRRTQFYTAEQYLGVLCNDISTVENQPGSGIQPVAESSFDAWIKYYRQNENSKNTGVSYYSKGALLGMVLDLEIIHATGAKKGLDDVMKAMYDEFFVKQSRGFSTEEFKTMAEKISGISLDNFFWEYVYSTGPIRFAVHLDHAGFSLVNENEGKNVTSHGFTTSVKEGKLLVTSVVRDGSAWTDGISVNDEIIALDGNRVTGAAGSSKVSDLEKLISEKEVGDKVNLLISRDGLVKTVTLTLKADKKGKFRIEPSKNESSAQMAVRKKWLNL